MNEWGNLNISNNNNNNNKPTQNVTPLLEILVKA